VEHVVNRMLYLILTAQLVITCVALAAYLVWNRVRACCWFVWWAWWVREGRGGVFCGVVTWSVK